MLARSHDGRELRLRRQAPAASRARKLLYPPVQQPYPPLFFGGSSAEAHELAAEQLDTYLTWGEPPAAVAEKVADIRARAARARPHAAVRHPAARDRARDRGRGLARRRRADLAPRRGHRRRGADDVRADGFGRPAPHGRAAQGRQQAHVAPAWRSRRTCGPASAWCAAAPARRWSATPRQVAARIEEYADARARVLHPLGLPAPGGSATASPSWCSRCCRSSCASALPRQRADRAVRRDRRQQLVPRAAAGVASHELAMTDAARSPCRDRVAAASTALRAMRGVGRRLVPWLVPVAWSLLWQLASRAGWLSTRVLPEPLAVVQGALGAGRLRRAVAARRPAPARALAGLGHRRRPGPGARAC